MFFRLAWRLPAYQGVMAVRVNSAQAAAEPAPQQQTPRPAVVPRPEPKGVVTAATVDPAFKGIFSFG